MSERWKYQIRMGGIWGLFMTVFMTWYEAKEHPLIEQLSSPQLYIRMVAFLAVGIFVLGYYTWKNRKGGTTNSK